MRIPGKSAIKSPIKRILSRLINGFKRKKPGQDVPVVKGEKWPFHTFPVIVRAHAKKHGWGKVRANIIRGLLQSGRNPDEAVKFLDEIQFLSINDPKVKSIIPKDTLKPLHFSDDALARLSVLPINTLDRLSQDSLKLLAFLSPDAIQHLRVLSTDALERLKVYSASDLKRLSHMSADLEKLSFLSPKTSRLL